MKTYSLGDTPTFAECEALNIERGARITHFWASPQRDGRYVKAHRTGEFRQPRKGEWYLSGATVVAYRAANNLSCAYHIARLCVVKRETRVVESIETTLAEND